MWLTGLRTVGTDTTQLCCWISRESILLSRPGGSETERPTEPKLTEPNRPRPLKTNYSNYYTILAQHLLQPLLLLLLHRELLMKIPTTATRHLLHLLIILNYIKLVLPAIKGTYYHLLLAILQVLEVVVLILLVVLSSQNPISSHFCACWK